MLDYKEVQPVHPKGNQSRIFIGRTDVEAETPILWPPHAKSWLIWKDPDVGKDWRLKGMTEGEVVRWHYWLNGHGFGWTLGVGDGQGGLSCCSSWGHKESDTSERLNWTELNVCSRFPLGHTLLPGALSVLVIFCCIKNYSNTYGLKASAICYLSQLSGLSGISWMACFTRCQLGL